MDRKQMRVASHKIDFFWSPDDTSGIVCVQLGTNTYSARVADLDAARDWVRRQVQWFWQLENV